MRIQRKWRRRRSRGKATRQTLGGNYLQRIAQVVEPADFKPGSVIHTTIRHDEWCGIFAGQDCDCDPLVVRGRPEDVGRD